MYLELHARSAFSFLEGASVPEELAEVCAHYQMPAMALLDRDGVYGAPRFHLAAQEFKVKTHIGAEITSLLASQRAHHRWLLGAAVLNSEQVTTRLPLLRASREGYQNLCRLVTRMKMRAPKVPGLLPQRETSDEQLIQSQAIASVADLAEYATGLICLTGGEEGPLASAMAHGGKEAGRRTLEELIAIYGQGNVYVELQRHYNRAQEARNQAAIELARSQQLRLLATQGASYAKPEERRILDVFSCIRNHRTLDTAGRLLARNSERYIKPRKRCCNCWPICRRLSRTPWSCRRDSSSL